MSYRYLKVGEEKHVYLDKTESLAESVIKNLFLLMVFSFCVYISQGSTWWTFVSGVLFLIYLAGKASLMIGARQKTFKTKKELIEFLNSND